MPVNMRGRVVDDKGTFRLISQIFPDSAQASAFAGSLSKYGITAAVQQSQKGGYCVVGTAAVPQNIQGLYNPQTDLYVFPDSQTAYAQTSAQYAAPAVPNPVQTAQPVRQYQPTQQPQQPQQAPPIRGKTVVCGQCGRIYSKSAKACPNCGAKNKKPFYSKWWFWTIIAVVLIAVIVPKGGKDADDITSDKNSSSDTGVSNGNNSGSVGNSESKMTKEDITFDQMTAIDNDMCSFVITEIDPDSTWGYTLKVTLENKSPDRNIMFSVDNASINGVNDDPLFAKSVAAGKKATGEINFSNSYLRENGILPVTDIELILRVHDDDDWSVSDYANTTVHVYPYGEDKAVQFVREPQPTDIVIVDNDYVTAIITGIDKDGFWGYTLNLYLVNKTDAGAMFSVENASVNGFMADPFFASSVTANKCKFASISWSDSALEESGIKDVEEIEFTFEADSSEDWSAPDYFKDIVKITP